MKNRIIGIFLFFISIFLLYSNANKVNALEYLDDNYNLNIVAVKDTSDCLTEYYTKIGDGDAIITFDLLYRSDNGYFGFVAGNSSTLGNITKMTDYFLFGNDVISSKKIETNENIFISGYTYKITLNNSENKISVDKKKILENNDSYQNILSFDNTFTSSNTVGIACYTKEYESATATIDNLSITSLNGKNKYVSNDFSSMSTVKDDSMVSLVTDANTGTKIYTGSIYIEKTLTFTVRFMAENGKILSEQIVSIYGTANEPKLPTKEGYELDEWSDDLTSIMENKIIYPIYKVKENKTDTKETKTKITTNTNDNTINNNEEEKSIFGCFNGIAVAPIILTISVLSIFILAKRRNENE